MWITRSAAWAAGNICCRYTPKWNCAVRASARNKTEFTRVPEVRGGIGGGFWGKEMKRARCVSVWVAVSFAWAWGQRPSDTATAGLIEGSREKALAYARSLPDFVCTEVITRYSYGKSETARAPSEWGERSPTESNGFPRIS